MGAATTATFGDIVPNSSSVRMLVCLQVLGSIVFSGLMINGLASGVKPNRSQSVACQAAALQSVPPLRALISAPLSFIRARRISGQYLTALLDKR
jgi:hypothetical protein